MVRRFQGTKNLPFRRAFRAVVASVAADLAAFISRRSWTFQQTEDFESSRECARNIVCKVGWDHDTDPLVTYWVCLTKVKVLNDGRDASDILPCGMGSIHEPPVGIDDLRFLNIYQKDFMKSEVKGFKKTCDLLIANVDTLWMSKESGPSWSWLRISNTLWTSLLKRWAERCRVFHNFGGTRHKANLVLNTGCWKASLDLTDFRKRQGCFVASARRRQLLG